MERERTHEKMEIKPKMNIVNKRWSEEKKEVLNVNGGGGGEEEKWRRLRVLTGDGEKMCEQEEGEEELWTSDKKKMKDKKYEQGTKKTPQH